MTENPFNFRSYENRESLRGLFFRLEATSHRAELPEEGEGHHHPRSVSREPCRQEPRRRAALANGSEPYGLTAASHAG